MLDAHRFAIPSRRRTALTLAAVLTVTPLFPSPAATAAQEAAPPTACTEVLEIIEDVERADQLAGLGCDVAQASVEVDGVRLQIPAPGHATVGAAAVIEGAEPVPTVMVANDDGVAVALIHPEMPTVVLGDDQLAEEALEKTGLEQEDHSLEAWDGSDPYAEEEQAGESDPVDVEDLGQPESAADDEGAIVKSSKSSIGSRCTSGSYAFFGLGGWQSSMKWLYNPAGAPVSGHESAIAGAATVMANAQNACGVAVPSLRSSHIYEGSTTAAAKPNITSQATCNVASDWKSRVGWGTLPSGTLAYACTYHNLRIGVQQEADIKFNNRTGLLWNTSSSCSGSRYDLRGVAVHEFGHAFGLNHVSESADQVMGGSVATCDTFMRKLQRGDTLGMIKRYRR